LYFASLPSTWSESEIKAFYQDIGGDASQITGCILLHQRQGLQSRAAIVKYISHVAALQALQLCKGSSVNMEVRFAERNEKGAGGKGKWQGHNKDGAVPVYIGLRVRNHANGHCGEVVACRGRTPGTFRVLSDNGQEWEWEVKRFVTEDGWPLQDVQQIPATIGMRIRCWMDNRTGRIAYIHNDWPQRIWVEFDDGEENEKDVTWFVCEQGGTPVGPGLTEKEWRHAKSGKSSPPPAPRSDYNPRWDYNQQWSNSKGRQDWSFPSKGRPQDMRPPVRSKPDRWEWEDRKGRSAPSWSDKERGKGPDVSGGSDLEDAALREVVDQLLDESNHGRVWITNWPGRYQSKLGQLREFLEQHPDKFTVIPQGGRRYTVAFADRNAAAKSKAAKEKGGKGKAAPKKLEWKRTEKQDGDGDTAGGTASEKPSRSVRRSDEEDPDATAFDAEGEAGEALDAADGAEGMEGEGAAEGAGDEEEKEKVDA